MDVRIRQPVSSDFPGVLKLCWSIYGEVKADPGFGDYVFFKRPTKANIRRWFNVLRKDIAKRNAVYCIAESRGHVLGQCFVRRDTPGSEISHVGMLSILVAKGYRNSGIGTKLLDFTIRKCKGRFEILHLRVFSSNKRAKRLYKRFGFRSFGVAPGFHKRGNRYTDREFMYLKL
jgi:ribosomal protein S18 acetylase RimI-like enzyme